MKIEIPISDLNGDELRNLLARFPVGVVKVVNTKAMWQTEMDLDRQPVKSRLEQAEESVRRTLPQPQKGNAFSNVADEIVKSFGG